tara:strand:+ start:4231 stop:4503 length:273 start_codon:yes stop_codon:yes gene_type:complete
MINLKDKLHIILGCSILVGATNLMTIPEVYADDTMDAEHCVPLVAHQLRTEYVTKLEQLVTDLYLFKIQSNINIAEEVYRERHSTEREGE